MKTGLANARRVGALALCALAAGPLTHAEAAPSNGLKKAKFKVTVDGVQTTTWKTDHKGKGGCDGDLTGSGTEKVRFSSRPKVVGATVLKGLSSPILSDPGKYTGAKLKLAGKVTRQGVLNAAPGGECGGAGGGSIPRDCGTKSFRGVILPMEYRLARRERDQLDISPTFIDDPFKNCPSGGSSFPTLVNQNENREMDTALPRSELFDKRIGRIIVVARGKVSQTEGEHTYVTKIRWVLTFDRVGGAKKRR